MHGSALLNALNVVEREKKDGAITLHDAISAIQEATFDEDSLIKIQEEFGDPTNGMQCSPAYIEIIRKGWEQEKVHVANIWALGQAALLLHNAIIDEREKLSVRGHTTRGATTPKNTEEVWDAVIKILNDYIEFPELRLEAIRQHLWTCEGNGASPLETPYYLDRRPCFFGDLGSGLPQSFLTAQQIVFVDIEQLAQCLDRRDIKHGLNRSLQTVPASDDGGVVCQPYDEVKWTWPIMKAFTSLDRKTIISRAGRLDIKFQERPPRKGCETEKGLRESDLRRIINNK